MQRLFGFVFALCATLTLSAQIDKIIDNYPIRNIGPAAMSGRITAIAVPRNTATINFKNTIYIGAASGGVWKSTNAGISWNPIFDEQDIQSIGSIAIDPNNANVIYVGTGEGNPRNSHNSGKGIYKSFDAGKTWKCIGLEATKTIHRIVINPLNSNQIYVAAMGSVWGPNEDRGVFKSNDGGQTWQKVLYTNSTTGCAELILDINNPNKIIANMYDFQRKPYTYRSGGNGGGLYVSNDAGSNWTKLSSKNGLPEGNLGRIGIAISSSNPDRIYALIESKNTAFYRSNDGGTNWYKTSQNPNIGNRPFYYSEIYVDPKNENRVFSIWSQISKSEDGGKNWEILADWGHIHPDHHAFFVHPDDPNFMINGNDGGLNISSDGGQTWRFAENIPVGQFYHVNVDNQIPYNVYGGLQDNGSWIGPGFLFKNGGIQNHDWQELLYGDGFDVAPIENNPNEGYAMYQSGNFFHYNLKTQKTSFIKPVHPNGINLRFNWNAALSLIPQKPNSLYYGSQFLHVSHNKGATWEIISPDLTTNDTAKLHQAQSGGLTIDATGAENYCTIISIAPNPLNPEKEIIVGTDDGQVQQTIDGGKSWSNLTGNIKGLPKNAWIPVIFLDTISQSVQSKNNKFNDTKINIWVVANNYRQNDWNPYLFRSIDGGTTWQSMITPTVKGHCLSIAVDPKNHQLVFLGTDQGLYVSLNGGISWKKWKKFPSCPVQDLKIQTIENDLVIGTFGRGIWIMDDISALRKLTTEISFTKNIQILGNSHGYIFDYNQPNGMRFGADGVWSAPNKPYGCNVNMYLNKKTDDKKIELTGTVYNSKNQLIRTHKFSFDSSGFYRISWRMIEDGFYFPTNQTPKADETLPSGRTVEPCKYKLIITDKSNNKDSAFVEVIYPNYEVDKKLYDQQTVAYNIFKPIVKRAYDAFEGIKQIEKTLNSLNDYKWENDSIKKYIEKMKKPLSDSITVLKNLFMMPDEITYYEESTVRLNDLLSNANSLISQGLSVDQNAFNAIKNAKNETEKVCQRINEFSKSQWIPFAEKLKKETIQIAPKENKY